MLSIQRVLTVKRWICYAIYVGVRHVYFPGHVSVRSQRAQQWFPCFVIGFGKNTNLKERRALDRIESTSTHDEQFRERKFASGMAYFSPDKMEC